jgi:uncharacterized protein (DUF1697 family)
MAKKSASHRYIAFLRGINVGGHRVKMEELAELFRDLGFGDVTTFIASGNVIFDAPSKGVAALERQVEQHLERELGYAAPTFIRTPAELARAIAAIPFIPKDANHNVHIGFLRESLGKEKANKLLSFAGEMDDFHVIGREMYWLCRGSTMESLVSWPVIAKTVGTPSTMRNVTMLRRLAAMHFPS